MNQISEWKLTFDPAGTPLVLLDLTSELDGDVDWGMDRVFSLTPLVRGAAPILRDGKNVSASIRFTVFSDTTTDAASRSAMLAAMIVALTPGTKPLQVEALGVTDRYWTFATALVTSIKPARGVIVPPGRRATTYNITAVSLSETIL